MPFWMGHWGWWWFPFHGLFTVLVLVIMALVIGSIARGPRHALPHGRSTALDMLEQRYARGEIQRDEYLQKKHDLGG